tara:strand:- start:60 stop:188 length:129 start_codon:yes stop_codon:yes gene_type:complete
VVAKELKKLIGLGSRNKKILLSGPIMINGEPVNTLSLIVHKG